MKHAFAALLVTMLAATPAISQELSPSPDGARVYIVSPNNGETISGPVTVLFGLEGMGVAPAGVEQEGTGHHHLLINADLPNLSEGIPSDDSYRHFGGGQTQATLELAPGTYRLRLLLGDHNHIPHDPPIYSEEIAVTVE